MISKRLFLADCIENAKHRGWVFWLQVLTFFISFPGALLLGLNSISQRRNWGYQQEVNKQLIEFTRKTFAISEWSSIFIVLLAVLAGIQAFSWLHNKQQVNFYHSQPVSRNRRFLVIWFNGIVSFILSYGINLGLGMLVAASYGCLSGEMVMFIPEAILAHLLLFMAVYHVAIVAVMLTGYTLVSLVATVVLLCYEFAVRVLYWSYAASFFRTYGSRESDKVLNTLFSPLVIFFRYIFSRNSDGYQMVKYTYSETMFTMAGLVILFGLAGWLLYKVRPSESHGKSISFSKIKIPLEIFLLLLLGSAGGLFIYELSGRSEVLGIGGAIFSVCILHVVIWLIYETDFRAARRELAGLGFSAVAVVFIFAVFRWDIFGYDEAIPQQKKVESVALSFRNNYMDNKRVLSDGTDVSAMNYWPVEMELTELDMVYGLLNNRVNPKEFEQAEGLSGIEVVFKLKNGKTIDRYLYFSYPDNLAVLNEIFHTPQYQTTTNQLMEENFAEEFNIFKAEYDNGRMNYAVPDEQVKALLEAYVKDVNSVDFADIYDTIPIGRMMVGGQGIKNSEFVNQWLAPIYPSFINTISLLKKSGIAPQAVCDEDYMEQVKSITITYTDYEALETGASSGVRKRIVFVNEGLEVGEDYILSERPDAWSYEKTERLKEILDSAVLEELGYWQEYGGGYPNGNYYIVVEIKEGEKLYSNIEHFRFRTEQIPEFVQKVMDEIK